MASYEQVEKTINGARQMHLTDDGFKADVTYELTRHETDGDIVRVNFVFHAGHDITDILDPNTIDRIEAELLEAYDGETI